MVRAFLPLLVLTSLASAAAAQQAPTTTPAWVKLCDRGALAGKDKDGKEEKKDLHICMTYQDRIDAKTGKVIFSAAVHHTQIDDKDRYHFRVMVPVDMLLSAGMRAVIFPKEVWEKVAKNEKLKKADEAKLKALKLTYAHCHAVGCVAEVEATPEILAHLKTNAGLRIFTMNRFGAAIGFDVSLAGFAGAFEGEPLQRRATKPQERGGKCDPYYDPVTNTYRCPDWQH